MPPPQPVTGKSMQWSLDATSASRRSQAHAVVDALDSSMGFDRFDEGPARVGWLVNLQPTLLPNNDIPGGAQAVDFYFLDEEGGYFKATLGLDPYFLVKCEPGTEADVEEWLRKILEGVHKETRHVVKDDLSLTGHLIGAKQPLIEIRFWNTNDLVNARRILKPYVEKNQQRIEKFGHDTQSSDASSFIIDLREHDVPYHVRLAIDLDVRVGKWYTVTTHEGSASFEERTDLVHRPDPVVLAFDIETTKAPLKFPDAAVDQIMMISYMIDGIGYLITNRELVSQDIEDFEYTPKPEFKGDFTIFNEPDERAVLIRFLEQVKEERPTVIATFNGDFFDWPFVDARAAVHGISLYNEIGFRPDAEGEYKSAHCSHMDCFRWVKRDSYLPQGSQGLKAVTKAKLGYNPLEISPELMTPYAQERPQVLAEYSVSDAVATYYLYMKFVHPFIFSLCSILPLQPDEVLRKGTGTLCEMLLMVQAYQRSILLPHKHSDPPERFYNGHLVESETYVGGHVESLEAGVFRSDIPTDFHISPEAVTELLDQLDAALKFTITAEHNMRVEDCTNYDAIRNEIATKLEALRDAPARRECPLIYHVDVASMYPNIMTTNRLQPDSMKSERDCAMCDFNRHGKTCDRRMPWSWRGEFYPPKKDEFLMIQNQLRREQFAPRDPAAPGAKPRKWDDLAYSEQVALTKKRVSDYSRTVYHKLRETETVEREAIVCQRENPFYVNTVRDFRDRRYEYKGLQKIWKRKLGDISPSDAAGREEAAKMIVLYDSMQLAHKCILNSFYGYVMRKGSRWYSMEMAGVTCLTGATIIQLARSLVERLGRPLELDTDGIWCILPSSFPGDLMFEYASGKSQPFAYPCTMLNHLVHEKFTNHQYQTLVDKENFRYETTSDNSIFFEVDGPYRCMMLPSSREEGKGLKKRYAVFNVDGSLAELKGFELKRRGELQLIKSFQDQVFSRFLEGGTLEECYAAVANAANSWLDVLDSRGAYLEDSDLISLISENKSMSKSLAEYGKQKSTSICTARRLAEFLGAQMVRDKGLNCQYIISSEPSHEPVTNRAVPLAIFNAEPSVKSFFLRKWLKKPTLESFDPRVIIDWKYYRERLEATIQKIITIPAARQGIANPVPRVPQPAWVLKQLAQASDTRKQQTIGFEKAANKEQVLEKARNLRSSLGDIEDAPGALGIGGGHKRRAAVLKHRRDRENIPDDNLTDADVLAAPDETAAPSPYEDYREWLVYMKVVWAKRRLQRQTRRRVFGDLAAPQFNRGVQGLIRNQAQRAFSGSNWQLLQVSSTGIPGQLRTAVWINGKIQVVLINVPRRVYIEYRTPPDSGKLLAPEGLQLHKCDDWLLPNGRAAHGRLYVATMSEQRYRDENIAIQSFLKDEDIVALHESSLDPVDRALIELGNICSLNDRPGLLGKGLSTGFDIDSFKSVLPTSGETYLSDAPMDFVHIQHFEVSGRHVCALSCTWSSQVSLFQHSHASLQFDAWNIVSEFSALYATIDPDDLLEVTHQSIELEVHSHGDLRHFWRAISDSLAEIHAERGSRAMAVLYTNRPARRILSRVRPLSEQFCTLHAAQPEGDTLPAIGWQPVMGRRIAKNIIRLPMWIADRKAAAAYARVPLGNVPSGDDVRLLADILYARRLCHARHLLWWGLGSSAADSDEQKFAADDAEKPSDVPGLYERVCIDISVANMVVNTVLTASFLTSAEGTEDTDGADALTSDAFSGPAWRILVTMLKEWWTQAAAANEVADRFVEQFGGWVASPTSALYSSCLTYQLATLSRKALGQLVSELRRLGISTVHTSNGRLVVATTKPQVESAFAFGAFAVRSVKANPLFTYLDISVVDYWDYLAWLDDANYCGRVFREMVDDNAVFENVSKWHLAEYLPLLLRAEFDEWTVQLMNAVNTAKDRYLIMSGDGIRPTQLPPKSDDETPATFAREAIAHLEGPLVNRVRKLNNHYIDSRTDPDLEAAEFSPPTRAGTLVIGKPENQMLNFVKAVLQVYNLAKGSDAELLKLRRRLLGVLKVGEFDPESQFKPPGASLVVTNVVCHFCNDCVSVDVCHPIDADSSAFTFTCPRCQHELDRVFLEERLVAMLAAMISRYQLQDLHCSKCGRVRPDDLSTYCVCSGRYTESEQASQVRNRARVFGHVAEYFKLRLLQSAHSELLA